ELVVRADRKRCGRRPTGTVPIQAPGPRKDHRQAQEPKADRPYPRGPFAEAKRRIGRRSRPVLQRRLPEGPETIETGCHPVAGDGHLPWNLGVTALVRVDQRAHRASRKPNRPEDDPQQPTEATFLTQPLPLAGHV